MRRCRRHSASCVILDLATEIRWPRFASFAGSQGVKSSYAIPMILNGQMIGVLNLYSIDNAFGPADEQIGLRFAAQAAMAVHTPLLSTRPGR